MTTYQYTVASPNHEQIDQGVAALNLASAAWQGSGVAGSSVTIDYDQPLSATDKASLDSYFATYVAAPTGKLKSIATIFQEVSALSAAQSTNVWNDIISGAPKKYLTDTGPNAAAIVTMDWAVTDSGATGASAASARKRIISFYVQDNDLYLWHPGFDTSISISGRYP
jgi:hypothetical protein